MLCTACEACHNVILYSKYTNLLNNEDVSHTFLHPKGRCVAYVAFFVALSPLRALKKIKHTYAHKGDISHLMSGGLLSNGLHNC